MQMFKQVVLIILDGWGYREEKSHNAIAEAKKPFFDSLWAEYPHAILQASGEAVGLPKGVIGNSEVGHMTIGAGRIVDSDDTRIFKAISSGEIAENPALVKLFAHVVKHDSTLHLLGLVSPIGVHSNTAHLYVILHLAKRAGVRSIVIHAFTDGRDSPPQSAGGYLAELEKFLGNLGVGVIGSVTGRYYAMDRDHNWDRENKTLNAIFRGRGVVEHDRRPSDVVAELYKRKKSDEFLEPLIFPKPSGMPRVISQNDGVMMFNFRPDRARMLAERISEKVSEMDLCFVTMTQYDKGINSLVAFPPVVVNQTLPQVVSEAGLTQEHIAETEKYAHVTYFLNGGREKKYDKENWVVIPSRKDIPSYDKAPAMMAGEITTKALEAIRHDVNFIVINYANADMVGHSGNEKATVEAIEFVDKQLSRLIPEILKRGGIAFVTADHGNAEIKVDPKTGVKDTAHTISPVPAILTVKELGLKDGGLSNVAPTILQLLGITKPIEMTAESLIER